MQSLAQLRKCVYPFPVYEAHFADGTVGRLSVWQAAGKPWNWERFRRISVICHAWRKVGPWSGPLQVAGYLEHNGERIADTMGAAVKPERVNSKAMVRELLQALDGGYWNPEAVAQARQWAA